MNTKEKIKLAELTSKIIVVIVMRVFKRKEDAGAFMDEMRKFMADETYLPDKMYEFPGDNPEAEDELRELMGVIFKRRI